MERRQFVRAGLAATLAAGAGRRARAAAWPEQEITLITGFGPGSGTDAIARVLAEHMGARFGVPVVVRNMPGAAGTLGPAQVARSRPDGYTFGQVSGAAIVTAPLTMALPYRPWGSFDFLACVSELRMALTVGKSLSQVRNVADFVALGKRRRITFGATNPGSAVSLFQLAAMTGAELVYVPFGGQAEVASQLLGGHIDCTLGTAEMAPLARSGEVRMLASAAIDRWPEFPEVPTLRELGYDTVTRQPVGFAAPAGLPEEIHRKLSDALLAAAHDPAVQARLATFGIAPRPLPRDEFVAVLRGMEPGLREVLGTAGMLRAP